MRCFLWEFNSCSRGWGDCLAFRHLFLLVHFKDSSIICDSFPPSHRASTDQPSIRLNSVFCANRCLLLFPASSSLWPWQEVHHCEESGEGGEKRKGSSEVGEIVWLQWNEGDWKWHLKWALVFFFFFFAGETMYSDIESSFLSGRRCSPPPQCWTEWKDTTEKLTAEELHHWLFASDSHFNNSIWRLLCWHLNPASKLVFVLLGSSPHYISSECALQPFWIAVM